MSGELNEYLYKVNEEAQNCFDSLIIDLAEKYDLSEELKAHDQLKWVGLELYCQGGQGDRRARSDLHIRANKKQIILNRFGRRDFSPPFPLHPSTNFYNPRFSLQLHNSFLL